MQLNSGKQDRNRWNEAKNRKLGQNIPTADTDNYGKREAGKMSGTNPMAI
jgi:hypothetical protein